MGVDKIYDGFQSYAKKKTVMGKMNNLCLPLGIVKLDDAYVEKVII